MQEFICHYFRQEVLRFDFGAAQLGIVSSAIGDFMNRSLGFN